MKLMGGCESLSQKIFNRGLEGLFIDRSSLILNDSRHFQNGDDPGDEVAPPPGYLEC